MSRVVGSCSRAALPAAGLVGPGSPDRDLARLPARVPGRARRRRPPARGGVRERAQGRRRRDELQRPALRADAPAVRRAARTGSRRSRTWTYWTSEFTVLTLALLWLYVRRHENFARFRNTLLLANVIGLLGYIADADRAAAAARARLRRRAAQGRPDPARREPVRRDAEPARGRRADRRRSCSRSSAGAGGRSSSGRSGRPGSGSPSWRPATTSGSTASPASGSRSIALTIVYRRDALPDSCRSASVGDRLPTEQATPADGAATVSHVSKAAAIKQSYTTGARRVATRSISGLARTRVTPNALTVSGVTLCLVASVLVLFESHNEMLFFWLGAARVRRRLDPRHPRRRARPRRRQVDALRRVPRLDHRPRRRGLHARRDRLRLRARRPRRLRRRRRRRGRRLVPRLVHPRPRRGARPARATSASAPAPSASS